MDASVTFLLNNLKEVIQYHVVLNKEATSELEELQRELELMKAKLKEASHNRDKGEVFSVWERNIREVVYDVEDVIDECIIQIAAEKAKKASQGHLFTKRPSLAKIITNTKLAEKVKHLRLKKVKPLFDEARNAFAELGDASQRNAGNQIVDKRNKVPRDNIVGFEDEIDKILNYLRADSEKMEVTTISGMPGLGKTTVAWKIFTDPDLEFEFPTRIWVNVSQQLNKTDVLLKILKEFTTQEMSGKTEQELVLEVNTRLESGTILLFLDDVWTSEDWREIQSFLPKKNKSCKVLITTRHEKVGWHANREKGPHKLRKLSFDEGWELLQLEVGDEVFANDTHLSGIGKRITKQCDGLPLSIIIIGGIMVDKIAEAGGSSIALLDEWKKISENVETSLNRDDSRKQMENIISLSYTVLPYDFRDCFLYLGMFPSGIEIPAWKLTHMWIAEGFVQEIPGKTPEQIAKDILKELITRNLLMVRRTKMNGDVKTCRVHDTIREFCKDKAEFKNQNLFQEITKKNEVFQPSLESIKQYRRLSVYSHLKGLLTERIKVPKARSFLCFTKDDVHLEAGEIQPMTDAFSLLRVFEANTIKFPEFPSDIVKLQHLRYVTLCISDLEILPAAISDLWNLQTLTVDTTRHSLNIHADLWKMMKLRHLRTKASIVFCNKNKKGEGGPNMQTLTMLSTQSCTDKVFDRVKNVTALGISGDLPELLKSKSLETFTRLEKLKLVNNVHLRIASENPLTRLPEPDKFPPNLRILTLSATHLEWKKMSVLQNLDTLMVLKLKNSAFAGDSWNTVGGGFLLLDTLYIERTDLEFWTAKDDAFPRLKNLVIKNCVMLTEAPLSQLKSLEMLSLERVTPSAVSSAMKVEQANKHWQENMGCSGRETFKLSIAPEDKLPRF